MIRAEWMRGAGSRSLHIEGHAGSTEYGHDLICAAVSALAGRWSIGLYISQINNIFKSILFV